MNFTNLCSFVSPEVNIGARETRIAAKDASRSPPLWKSPQNFDTSNEKKVISKIFFFFNPLFLNYAPDINNIGRMTYVTRKDAPWDVDMIIYIYIWDWTYIKVDIVQIVKNKDMKKMKIFFYFFFVCFLSTALNFEDKKI